MNGGSASPGRSRSAESGDSHAQYDLLELRSLLLGVEQQRLNHLEERLDNPESRAGEIGPLLPAIVRRAVETNAVGLSEALFVVLAPAIRSAISAALHDLLVNLDRVLQSSFSAAAWQWRIEQSGRVNHSPRSSFCTACNTVSNRFSWCIGIAVC